jgi:hypothetical protein
MRIEWMEKYMADAERLIYRQPGRRWFVDVE